MRKTKDFPRVVKPRSNVYRHGESLEFGVESFEF